METRVRVLIVEDSRSVREFLADLIESDPRLQVMGMVGNGQEAIDFVAARKPDVILMDLYMPRVDGFEATRRIMETGPVPIVICSAIADPRELNIAFRALEAGALACIEKPVGRQQANFGQTAGHLLETIRLMSEVKVVRRSTRRPPSRPLPEMEPVHPARGRLVAIGASTGGPPVLQAILADLPKDFRAPIVVVQHIAKGFVAGMADWLNLTTPLQVQVASMGIVPIPGHVYLAPDGFQMGVRTDGSIALTREPPEGGLRPSVSYLFRSVSNSFGEKAVGVLLTGMGRDGADELKVMKDRGAATIAQDRLTSVIHGMPGAAIEAGGASYVAPAGKIADLLISLVQHDSLEGGGQA